MIEAERADHQIRHVRADFVEMQRNSSNSCSRLGIIGCFPPLVPVLKLSKSRSPANIGDASKFCYTTAHKFIGGAPASC